MKEYGGYIQLDACRGQEYHPELYALNSGRAALRFLIRCKNIRKIYIPYFCCSTVQEACQAEGIEFEYYHIGTDFKPDLRAISENGLGDGEWFYLVNFYGVLRDTEIADFADRIRASDQKMDSGQRVAPGQKTTPGMTRMIADYTHSFFQKPLPGIPTLYSCRKFFGVADGSYVSASGCDALAAGRYQNLPVDVSYDRMHFLLGRFEAPASEFYQEYAENNEIFTTEPVKQMSKLTHNLLRGIDYEFVKEQRSANFAFLHRHLKKWNRLDLPDITGAYAYPFWPKEGLPEGHLLRRPLISQKIYVPTLWPEVLSLCTEDSPECPMAADILPLPVDQRYGEPDMMEILKILESLLPG